jgi:hypothetical protein
MHLLLARPSDERTHLRVVWSTMQRELLDTRIWLTPRAARRGDLRVDRSLVQPRRRHTALGMLSPIDYEHQWRSTTLHTAPTERHDHHTTRVRKTGSGSGWINQNPTLRVNRAGIVKRGRQGRRGEWD